MRIKRFEARDIHSAMAMVKEELGEDAVILSTRTLKPQDGTAATRRARVEIVAAMDYDQEQLTVPPPEPLSRSSALWPAGQGYDSRGPRLNTVPPPDAPGRQEGFKHTLSTELAARKTDADPIRLEANDLRLRLANFLKRQYCAGQETKNNGRGAKAEPATPPAGRPDPRQVAQWREKIIEQLRIIPLAPERGAGPTVLALVGPTGVGKTTTAAKIAAWYSIHESLNVALVSMDCYRIGATDQLRTYAKIMRLPCEIVLRRQDLTTALARHQDKDLVIIDTAGKSPYDPGHIRELADWFATVAGIEAHLVVSATCKKEDLRHLLRAYEALRVNGLVLTKLDETRAYAALCQELAESPLPISCLCTGQRVPEDFLLASREFLLTLFGQGWQTALPELESAALGKWAQ
jgi:flagellar biosynthesis protein FlhF